VFFSWYKTSFWPGSFPVTQTDLSGIVVVVAAAAAAAMLGQLSLPFIWGR